MTVHDGPNSDKRPPTVKMMVLETDEPHPEALKERGTYGEILHDHFKNAGDAHKPPLDIKTDTRFVVEDKGGKVPRLEEFEGCHAVLLTGSMYDAHAQDVGWVLKLLALLEELWLRRQDMRFSGVCFGHQLLCRLLGAEVAPSPARDWELGHSKISLTTTGQRLFQTDQPHVFLHQMHQDHVVAAPEAPFPRSASGVEGEKLLLAPGRKVSVWGSSPHTAVQGVYIPGRLFTTQAHLAFDEEMVKREMEMRVEQGALDPDKDEAVDRAAETAHLAHDGDAVAAAILRFFHGEDDEIN